MPYKYFEDIAVADVAFEATGNTLPELFESSALAVTNTMVKDLEKIKKKVKREFRVEAENIENLLHKFMQEIIFYKDAELLLFRKFKIKVKKGEDKWECECVAEGEKLDMKKHELLVDVKAVTWHQYSVQRATRGWKAFVILDI